MHPMNHTHRGSPHRFFSSILLTVLIVGGVCFARPRTDVLHFVNGDRLTCEIIKLAWGLLYVKLE